MPPAKNINLILGEMLELQKNTLERVEKLDEAVDGDPSDEGKPGIRIRLDRLEQRQKTWISVVSMITSLVALLTATKAFLR